MKITEFPSVKGLDPANMFLLDGPNGTKIIYAPDLAEQLLKIGGTESISNGLRMSELIPITSVGIDTIRDDAKVMIGLEDGNVGADLGDAFFAMVDAASKDDISVKRGNYRGKNLGSVVTDEQYAAIRDGSFKGLFLGDYWYIGGRNWRIMDFDYWWNTGDTPCLTHHLVIMPDETLVAKYMHPGNTAEGGYFRCRGELLPDQRDIAYGAFGEAHILVHREYFDNAVTNGQPSAGAWYDSGVELPSEVMVYGAPIFKVCCPGGTLPPDLHTVDKTQLAGMAVNPNMICPLRQSYWLRDVVAAAYYAVVGSDGRAHYNVTSIVQGVRIVFGLRG